MYTYISKSSPLTQTHRERKATMGVALSLSVLPIQRKTWRVYACLVILMSFSESVLGAKLGDRGKGWEVKAHKKEGYLCVVRCSPDDAHTPLRIIR